MTYEIALNILMTACLGYVVLNTIFRYHYSVDRIYFLGAILVFLGCVYYRDTTRIFESILFAGLILVFVIILKIVSYKKARFGYFLFNTYQKTYSETNKSFYDLAETCHIEKKNINYSKQKPWLVCFKNTPYKNIKELMNKADKLYTHKPITFTMTNYWFLIGFLVAITIIWRF